MNNKSFSLVEEKLAEAKFFLRKLEAVGANIFEARWYFSAFVSAARSVTFCLMAVMAGVQEFEEWYSERQEGLRRNSVARFFVERRNESLKVGNTRINSGVRYHDEEGQSGIKYYFSKSGPMDSFEGIESDVVTASQQYLGMLKEIVTECSIRFGSKIDPDKFYTMESLERERISIEDVEQMLGFPRGWTEGIPDEERLRVLRESTPPLIAEWVLRNSFEPEAIE